ncbi:MULTISPECIES: hypothetical protein [unclassified Microcoleus]
MIYTDERSGHGIRFWASHCQISNLKWYDWCSKYEKLGFERGILQRHR